MRDGWDGNLNYVFAFKSKAFQTLAAKMEDAEVSSESSDDDETHDTPPSIKPMSRQERKALDREIPW